MVIKRKPAISEAHVPAIADEAAFEVYLSKGGSVPEASVEVPKKDVKFTLTIPGDLCEQLDTVRSQLPIKTARHKWVLEAIYEKIQRDTDSA